jgi:leucine dehydrogenase
LREAGASVLVSDVDRDRVQQAAQRIPAEVVAPEAVYATDCDIFAPCAVGAILNESSIPLLRCRIVAGSANNQLGEPADALRLLERGILYVPDYIINAGGARSFALMDRDYTDLEEIADEMKSIGVTVREVLQEAAEQGETPVAAAERRVQRTLAHARHS